MAVCSCASSPHEEWCCGLSVPWLKASNEAHKAEIAREQLRIRGWSNLPARTQAEQSAQASFKGPDPKPVRKPKPKR